MPDWNMFLLAAPTTVMVRMIVFDDILACRPVQE